MTRQAIASKRSRLGGSARLLSAWLVLGCLAMGTPAWGQDAKARAEATQLEKDADTAFENGQWKEALEKYDRIAGILPQRIPVKLRAARCLERMGRLIEADARYGDILDAPRPPRASRQDLDAIESAKGARASLDQKIPRVIIKFEGTSSTLLPVEVKLDGQPFPNVKVETKQPIDPGNHKVEGYLDRGGKEREYATTPFVAKEGETAEVILRFGTAKPPGATPQPGGPKGGQGEDYWAILKRGRSTQRTIGWIMVGTGGFVFLGGGVTTVAALGVKSSLENQCEDRKCGPDAWGDVDTYDTLQALTTIFYLAGAAGVGVGIALLATTPGARGLGSADPKRKAARSEVTVSPWVGVGSAGLVGSF